jgi:hypothetical protein
MSQELIYTSVPAGLKPGSKGFCTVAVTAGLAPGWVERLESLSGYRPVYALGDPKSEHNPINWSHWRIVVAGKSRSVLSRVAFAGADYSGRSNKLAHHIVVEPAEQAAGGPAWMELKPGVLRIAWTEAPHQVPSGPKLPIGDRAPHACTAWAKVRGDAGWAGALAESFATEPTKPAYLVYAPGTDVLSLFEESLSLLPPAKRWEVTFSTFFTELPLNLTCAWRAVVAGTPAAIEAVRMGPRALVLDLTKPAGSAPTGIYVDAAQAGSGPVMTDVAAPRPGPAIRKPAAGAAETDDRDDTKFRMNFAEEEFDAITPPPKSDGRKRLLPVAAGRGVEEELPEANDLSALSNGLALPQQTVVYRGTPTWLATTIAVLCLIIGLVAGVILTPLISRRPTRAGPVAVGGTPDGLAPVTKTGGLTGLASTQESADHAGGSQTEKQQSTTKTTTQSFDVVPATMSVKVAKRDDASSTQPGPPAVAYIPSVAEEIREAEGQNPSPFDDKTKEISLSSRLNKDEQSFDINLPQECDQPASLALAWPNGNRTFTLADPPRTLSEARDPDSALTLVISAPLGDLNPDPQPLVNLQAGDGKIRITRVEKGNDALIDKVINALEYSEFLVRAKGGKKPGLRQYCLNVAGQPMPVSASGDLFVFDRQNLPPGFDVKNIKVDAVDGTVGNWKSSSDYLHVKFTYPLSQRKTAEFTIRLKEDDAGWRVIVDNGAFEKLKRQKTAATQATTQDTEVGDWVNAYNMAFKRQFTLSLRLPNGVEVRQIEIGPLRPLAQ